MKHDTAGDPISGLKWTRRTTHKIAQELKRLGIQVSANTVARLLKDMGFSLRVNHKKISTGSGPERDQQFAYIAELRASFARDGMPIISVDTKKKELVGHFKNPGVAWNREPTLVNDHDFRSHAKGIAVPYGIYDLQANQGFVFVGRSHDTAEFAVDNIEKWWRHAGLLRYPNAKDLLILADCGGSNGPRIRAWKHWIQENICDRHGISVTVSHYPAGASKWNPIEHRLFSEISKNWAGEPLTSFQTALNFIRTTKTSKGLSTSAFFVRKKYVKGLRFDDEQMASLCLLKHNTLPKWNYTLEPRRNRELISA